MGKDFTYLKSLDDKNLLGNFTAFDPKGEFLFNCDSKKALWYVKKNLAEWINESKTHFKLNFVPKGPGNSKLGKYFTEYIPNQCVICSSDEHLTKHHIVPSCYRRHFPDNCKSNDHFDVLLTCVSCHEKIERLYDEKKKLLAKHYKGELEHKYNTLKEMNSLVRSAQKHQNYMDDSRKQIIVDRVKKIRPELDTFDKILTYDLVNIGGTLENEICEKIVNDSRDDLKNFIILWREFFLDECAPEFLPNGWHSDYKTHFKF